MFKSVNDKSVIKVSSSQVSGIYIIISYKVCVFSFSIDWVLVCKQQTELSYF